MSLFELIVYLFSVFEVFHLVFFVKSMFFCCSSTSSFRKSVSSDFSFSVDFSVNQNNLHIRKKIEIRNKQKNNNLFLVS